VAKLIKGAWEKAGIETLVEVADTRPMNYDAYLAYVALPADPDQYVLWHSTQTGNISGYKSFKIDKLLEEGRQEIDQSKRKNIYQNFQKAITEDVPAAFLFYPKVYTIER
jgi:ABC-type transport system substrate-binding protein